MKKIFILFTALIAFSTASQAQDSCRVCKPYLWEAGIPIGVNQYFGDMHCSRLYMSENNLMLGAFVRRHLTDYFSLRGQAMVGRLAGNDLDQPDGRWNYRRLKFRSPLTELALLGELYPFKERKYTCDGVCRKTLTPYLYGGIAGLFTNPTLTTQPGATFPVTQRDLDDNASRLKKAALAIPVGLGIKYNATERFTIGAEAGYRYAFSDFLDGYSPIPFSKINRDGYALANLMAGYRFGDKDTDKDGVVNRCDVCPSEKGLRKFQGCPDTDGDGIPDKDDACPTQAGPMALKGCPDTDGDGIADKDDECPTQVGTAALRGCPDRDGDGVADKEDACVDVAGVKDLKGCPDADGDGIADKDDACPTMAGSAALNGCPDTDGDGIADKDDDCPAAKGTSALRGCPDRDGDGIADNMDKCPDTPGVASNNGCPQVVSFRGYRTASGCEISEAELAELNNAAQCIEFYAGTNKLKPSSYACLDRVCALMKRCPDTMLHIITYNDGANTAANIKLAKLRACGIYGYFLKKKCISKARMTYEGMGDEDPSASYINSAGKKTGSRTEFQLR